MNCIKKKKKKILFAFGLKKHPKRTPLGAKGLNTRTGSFSFCNSLNTIRACNQHQTHFL